MYKEGENPRRVEEEQKEPHRVFVEVGTNQTPVPLFGSRSFKGNDVYVGIDVDKKQIRDARHSTMSIAASGHDKENLLFVRATGEHLPLKDSSADEVFLGNVFGDRSIQRQQKISFLRETWRALKKDGRLIIEETYSPLNHEELEKLLTTSHFSVERLLREGSPELVEELKQYLGESSVKILMPGSYLLYLRKKENGSPLSPHSPQ